VTPTPRITGTVNFSATATRRVTATATLTPTAPLPIVPGNAISLTQTVLTQVMLTGTQPARLDQVAWAPDGQLAAAGAAGALFAQGETLTATRGYTMGVWVPSLSFSTDNRALALSSVGGTVRLFSRDNGALLFQLVQPNLRVSQVRYRPGPPGVLAQYLASLGGDNTVYVWDVAYRKFLGTLNPGPSSAEALEISGDGHFLAAASGNTVWVWDMTALPAGGWTGAFAPTLTLTQAGVVTGLALSQDGFLLAASNAAGTIELWTLPGGQPFGAFGRLSALPARLAFSPDGQLVAAAYGDQVIRLWALVAAFGTKPGQAAAPLAELGGHTARITSLAFSPDGSVLASSSWDGTVRLWAVR
jgi:WD40 repeat protein